MVPDVAGITRRFDYAVPPRFDDRVTLGTIVRVDLHGRRVGGWVVADEVEPPDGVDLKPLAHVSGHGPAPDVLSLAHWAAWRWAGRLPTFLRAASPPGRVVDLPIPPADRPPPSTVAPVAGVAEALAQPRGVLRLPPAADRFPVVIATLAATPPGSDALVLCPSVDSARALTTRLRRAGVATACVAHHRPGRAAAAEWARAGAGGVTVVGARSAAWAPVPRLGRVLVLDEHDEGYAEEGSPTWHARDVVIERAARAGVPLLLVSPIPTLEAQSWGTLEQPSRAAERRGWPPLIVVDRREEDPAAGLLTESLASALRRADRAVCVVNRTGRSRLSACATCREILACAACQGPVAQPDESTLECVRCGTVRPLVCAACGATRFKVLRPGVARLGSELSALIGEPVDEVTGGSSEPPRTRVVVGTEAALHRVSTADLVAFLDFDQELLSRRERAREQALALLVRAARLVRGREERGRVLVQTRRPDDVVVQAALQARPALVSEAEDEVRRTFGLSPHGAVADVSGEAAEAFVAALGHPDGVRIMGGGGAWRVQADDHATLCDALASVERPPGRIRIDVDPLRA